LDLSNSKYFIRSSGVNGDYSVDENGCTLENAELYQVSYTEPMEVLAKEREMIIPFTQVSESVSAAGEGIRNFQFSLGGKKLKKMIMHRLNTTSGSEYNGRTYSNFQDSNLALPSILIKYNDKQYFPEYCPMDTRIFDYKNQCNLFAQYCQPIGTHDPSDQLFLSGTINALGCDQDLRSLIWGDPQPEVPFLGAPLNNVILPFSLVEFNSSLIGDLNYVGERISDKPIQIQILPQGNGNFIDNPYVLVIHNELQMVALIKPNDVMIMNG
jgi:hypothetical protein